MAKKKLAKKKSTEPKNAVMSVVIDNPDYSALVARVHGGWEARTYAYLKLVTNDGKLVSAKS